MIILKKTGLCKNPITMSNKNYKKNGFKEINKKNMYTHDYMPELVFPIQKHESIADIISTLKNHVLDFPPKNKQWLKEIKIDLKLIL